MHKPYTYETIVEFIITVYIQLPTGSRIKFPSLSLWSQSIRTNFHGRCSLLCVALSLLSFAQQTKAQKTMKLGCFQTINNYFPRVFTMSYVPLSGDSSVLHAAFHA